MASDNLPLSATIRGRRTGALLDPAAELRQAGYEPLDPYPGTVAAQWHARCTTCGAERRPSLHDIRKGKRCAHRGVATSTTDAAAEARAAGFEPMEPYPRDRTAPWLVRCTTCDAERWPSLKSIRDGWKCKHRYATINLSTTEEKAEDELRSADYEPLEPYPGKTKAVWRVRCTECATRRTVTLNRVRNGERCKHWMPTKKRRGNSNRASLPAKRIISCYEAGESLKSIAEVYETSAATIRRLLEEYGVERRPAHHKFVPGQGIRPASKMTPAEKIISEYREGASLRALAKRYGISTRAVVRLMESRGEERRSSGEAQKGVSKVLDKATEDRIISRNQRGESLGAIAASLGISRGAAILVLKRRSVEATSVPRGPKSSLPMPEISARHAAGESPRSLAAEFGVHPATIRRRLRDAEQRDSQ